MYYEIKECYISAAISFKKEGESIWKEINGSVPVSDNENLTSPILILSVSRNYVRVYGA